MREGDVRFVQCYMEVSGRRLTQLECGRERTNPWSRNTAAVQPRLVATPEIPTPSVIRTLRMHVRSPTYLL